MNHKRILVISDLHIPYHHQDAFKFLKAIKKEFKPDRIVNIGDCLDFHAISMHDHNPDLPSAGSELSLSKEYIKEYHIVLTMSLVSIILVSIDRNSFSTLLKCTKFSIALM